MARNMKWKQSDNEKCPLCRTKAETIEHVLQCQDQRARTCRSMQILELRKTLKGINTAPFITNHFCRIITQFTYTYPVSTIKTNPSTSIDDQQRASGINEQIELGIPLLLSGFITKGVSEIQQKHLEGLQSSRRPNIRSWCKSAIKHLLEFTQTLWKFRSEILYEEATFTQEAMLLPQAINLLQSLRKMPYSLHKSARNLLDQSTSYLQTTHLRNVISWTKRVNRVLEQQSFSEKNTINDIRTWIYSGELLTAKEQTRLRHDGDDWYDPHSYDSDDSEITVNLSKKYPDEADNSWILLTTQVRTRLCTRSCTAKEPYCSQNKNSLPSIFETIGPTITNSLIAPK